MRRPRALLLSFLLPLVAIFWYVGGYSEHEQPTPRLIIDASVAPDFAAVIQQTWRQFLLVFAARRDCFGDVRVKADYVLSERAMYDPQTATISVRVPERASILKGALVHEWAYHVEFQCEAHTEMRAAFIEAQNMPANTPWRSASGSVHLFSLLIGQTSPPNNTPKPPLWSCWASAPLRPRLGLQRTGWRL